MNCSLCGDPRCIAGHIHPDPGPVPPRYTLWPPMYVRYYDELKKSHEAVGRNQRYFESHARGPR